MGPGLQAVVQHVVPLTQMWCLRYMEVGKSLPIRPFPCSKP